MIDFDVIFFDAIIGIYKTTEFWKYFEKKNYKKNFKK